MQKILSKNVERKIKILINFSKMIFYCSVATTYRKKERERERKIN